MTLHFLTQAAAIVAASVAMGESRAGPLDAPA
jgi:hypothetical protein